MELPKLLASIGEIDIFFHDSKHTYEHMFFEFEAAFQRLRLGGVLASDDISWNSAFFEFCRQHDIEAHSIGNGGFAIRK
jgi:hypothetical protein